MEVTFAEIHDAINQGVFTPPKPKNEQSDVDKKIITELESRNKLMIQRKDDGNGHIVVIGKKPRAIDIYTLGLNAATLKYPHLVGDLQSLRLPKQTILCNEISYAIDGVQDRYAIGKITNSSIQNALTHQNLQSAYPEM